MIDRTRNTSTTAEGDLLGSLRRRKAIILFAALIGGGLGVLYQSFASRAYRAESEILIMTRASELAADETQKGMVHEDVLSTHIELFSSNLVVSTAIKKHRLDELIPSIKDVADDGRDVVRFIREQLKVSKGGDGRARDANILQVSYEDASAENAADVLAALVSSYQESLADMFSDNSNDAVGLIEKARTKLAQDLKDHEALYSEFRQSAPLVWDGEKATNLHNARVRTAESSLGDVRRRMLEIRARLKVIETFLDSNAADEITDLDRLALLNESETERLRLMYFITRGDARSEVFISEQSVRSAQVKTEYERLLSLRLKEQSLRRDYDEDHPMVESVRDQIALVEKFLRENAPGGPDGDIERMSPREVLTTFVGVLNNDLDDLRQREKELEALAKAELAASQELVHFELQDQAMQAETRRLNLLYDAIVARLREVDMIRDYGGFLTRVITPPQPPQSAAWPRLPISLGLGLLLGLTIGFGLAMLAESSDTTFRDPDDLSEALNLPILAHTNLAASRIRRASPETLVTVRNPRSMEAESYRTLRASVFLSDPADNDCKVLVVTSPVQGDGKTTTSSNLAVTFAQSGRRTLLIDCDMRRPRVANVFKADRKRGLATVLTNKTKLMDSIQSTSIENLDVLTAGGVPDNPAELLGSDNFALMLDVLREKYDRILLDTPPLLPVSDPRLVAAKADGVILAMRVHKNGRELGVRARQLLESSGTRMLGLVVTASGRSGTGYEYGYRNYASGVYGYNYNY